ncbi:BppU family phage baseplate upper protein [Staphylococcus hominis]|uniref:BppU family phage baseplate upper protein n=1 Tax=Staphylococcus hominis TaxID=1290 RepID=UPI001F5848E8|nr:BppU family phage baseplate upper protein [Staphylococcus hominis]MCI2919104.1 BppU family phage baseplate upper protein [Staphylococcus hominis]MDK7928298.1 BppU family phage baseplate upper protein [Staphylococcus hominis]MDS3927105.1 BppU family phage baseplate upper protein [Staphylococcus hominis]
MSIYKSKDIVTNINERGVNLGNINVIFYSMDKNTTALRIFIKKEIVYENRTIYSPINLNQTQMIPRLVLVANDGSIFYENVDVIDPENGVIQYQLSENIIKHTGKMEASVLLIGENNKESSHVADFYFYIEESRFTGAIGKEVDTELLEDIVAKIMSKNAMGVMDQDFLDALELSLKDYIFNNPEQFKMRFSDLTYKEKQDLISEVSQQTSQSFTPEQLQKLKGPKGEDGKTLNTTAVSRNLVSGNVDKPMITFIDDDGRVDLLQKWVPILEEKRNKLTVALVTDWLEKKESTVIQWGDVHDLEKRYGVEFVSHTHTHPHAIQLTDDIIDYEFKTARDILKRENLTYNIIVQPFGENTESVRKISRNYARANFGIVDEINTIPYNTFKMKRVPLGEEKYTTFEQYKLKIDEAIEKNGWLVFKSHSQYESFNKNQIEIIKQIIDYCRENGVLEVTLEEGLDLTGNLIDVGDFDQKSSGSDYYILDNKGKVYSNTQEKNYYTLRYNSVKFNTNIDEFKDESTSVLSVTGTNAIDFPEKSNGTLLTVKALPLALSYQLFFPYKNDIIYKRRWNDDNKTWTRFVKLNSEVREEYTRQYTPNTTILPNSTTDVTISNSILDALSFGIGNTILGVPEQMLPNGILYNVYISDKNKIVVRLSNVTTNQITIPATHFNFKITIS